MDRSKAHAGEFGMVKTSGEGTGPRKGEMRKSVGDWMAIFRKSTGFGPLRHPKLVPNQLSSIRRYRLCEWRVNMIPHKPLNLISPATRRTANPAHPTRHRFFCHRRHEIISPIQARMPSDGKSRCGPRQHCSVDGPVLSSAKRMKFCCLTTATAVTAYGHCSRME